MSFSAQINGSKKLIKKSARAEIFIPADSAKVNPKNIYSENVFTCFGVSLRGWGGEEEQNSEFFFGRVF